MSRMRQPVAGSDIVERHHPRVAEIVSKTRCLNQSCTYRISSVSLNDLRHDARQTLRALTSWTATNLWWTVRMNSSVQTMRRCTIVLHRAATNARTENGSSKRWTKAIARQRNVSDKNSAYVALVSNSQSNEVEPKDAEQLDDASRGLSSTRRT